VGTGPGMDWTAWNDRYDDPQDPLVRRLAAVETELRAALDTCPPGPLRLLSLCAGQGRDVVDVLAGHPRARDVSAVLVEFDAPTVDAGRQHASDAGVAGLGFRCADASQTDPILDAVPADVVLMCGVFGNLATPDVRRAITYAPALCRPGGSVIWTRNRAEPGLVATTSRWFAEEDFDLVHVNNDSPRWSVTRHRYTGPRRPLPAAETMFRFVGHDVLAAAATPPVPS